MTAGRAEVVTETEDLPRERWLELRRLGLGGSDAPAVVGVSHWASPYAVYLDKIGAIAEADEKPWMTWGRKLEDVVAQGFAEEVGVDVHPFPVMLRDREHPHMLANLDRLVGGSDLTTAKALLECKVVIRADRWEDGPPVNYELQVAHYLAVTGLPRAIIAGLFNGHEIRWWEIERDEDLIVDLVEVERDFWARVEERRPPPIDGLSSTTDAMGRIRSKSGLEIELPPEARKIIADLRYAKATTKAAEETEAAIANRLKELMGEAEIGLLGGMPVVTWKQHERENLDTKKLKLDHPDVCAPYKSKSKYRSLLLKTTKESDRDG